MSAKASLVVLLAVVGCSDPTGDVLLLTLTATNKVDSLDILIKRAKDIVLEERGEPVDPGDPNRDISQPNQVLKLAFEFSTPGTYLVYVLGHRRLDTTKQFALHRYKIDGIVQAALLLLPLSNDHDEDGFPACGSMSDTACREVSCDALDCDDRDEKINPLAEEVCGNLKDDDCSAGCGVAAEKGDVACEDNDGDGVPSHLDCDDDDPCRSPDLKETAKLCGEEADEFPALPAACIEKHGDKVLAPPHCGDGIDQDCNGQDIDCVVDEDCDDYPPPQDCNDEDPKIKPGAKEVCDDIDNNCNGTTDEGCTPCDIDGDNHASPENKEVSCTLPKDDPDDLDSGVHPDVTTDTEGKEGGTVLTALRRFCSSDLDKDGKPQRQIDHDADGIIAASDGCPEASCDLDGDGFAGAQCTPPKSQEDCNDGDPTVFPGAPDKCGDTIKQNCSADVACEEITDGDNDGYAVDVDCDDNDAARFPWAVEKCDSVDNDCDGLVDEGNPDPDGVLIPGKGNNLCNDDNDGKCGNAGKLSGDCACSQIVPSSVREENNRVVCKGEDLAADASPRCFGAVQPVQEKCDTEDWDCNGVADDKTGSNLQERGDPCSIDEGSCKQGVVVGCDLTQTLADPERIEAVLGSKYLTLVCSSDTLYPITELCNGKDDDCDGNIPDDETDGDGDGYIACGDATVGCTIGAAREDLDSDYKGCGDCDESGTGYVINPGALERCNGEDDNCRDGLDDDGEGQCTGGTSCCASDLDCFDLDNDDDHCGSCTRRCRNGEHCASGQCRCGSSPACASSQNCIAGGCVCIEFGNCSGCCDGNTCRSRSTTNCGVDGSSCTTCSDPGDCEESYCSAIGDCEVRYVSDGTSCANGDGRCRNNDGTCCKKCWNTANNKCEGGANDDDKCGTKGEICDDCLAIGLDCNAGDCG